jgi:hypothetical protein
MKLTYKPVLLEYTSNRGIVERYIEDICNLNNISNELYGNILFAVTETLDILFSLRLQYGFSAITVEGSGTPRGLMFNLSAKEKAGGLTGIEDEIEGGIRKNKMEQELFIVEKLADKIVVSKKHVGIALEFFSVGISYDRVMDRISNLQQFWNRQKALKGV